MISVAIAVLVLGQGVKAPGELTDATFAAVHTYATPTKKDLAFQSLDWKDSIYEGLVESQRQDKPMVMWMYFGDPRGHC